MNTIITSIIAIIIAASIITCIYVSIAFLIDRYEKEKSAKFYALKKWDEVTVLNDDYTSDTHYLRVSIHSINYTNESAVVYHEPSDRYFQTYKKHMLL